MSVDGYIADSGGDMSWAKRQDKEWEEYVTQNASGASTVLLGRVTYDLMSSFWPTPQAIATFPAAAAGMNRRPKIVFSRTLERASWQNTTVIEGDIGAAVRAMKQEPGEDLVILGSGSIVAQLARAHLIDEFQIMVSPILLGAGKTMFHGVEEKLALKEPRIFGNGNVLLRYDVLTR